MRSLTFAFCALGCSVSLALAATDPASTTFDLGLEDWTIESGGLVWMETGGNPGGFAHFSDSDSDGGFLIAPASYLGDWSAFDGTGSLSWDHRVIDPGGGICGTNPYEAILTGPGGVARFQSAELADTTGVWSRVEVSIDESSWNVESGSWLEILEDVQNLRIRIEHVCNAGSSEVDREGIDNVSLLNGVSSVPTSTPQTAIDVAPNPSRSAVRITYMLGDASPVRAEIFDLRGRLQRSLMDGKHQPPGRVEVVWDGRDETGHLAPSGIYFVRWSTPAAVESRRILRVN